MVFSQFEEPGREGPSGPSQIPPLRVDRGGMRPQAAVLIGPRLLGRVILLIQPLKLFLGLIRLRILSENR